MFNNDNTIPVHLPFLLHRLRIEVLDINKTNIDKLKALGVAGVLTVGNNLQAIFGPRSETRVRVGLEDASILDEAALMEAGVTGIMRLLITPSDLVLSARCAKPTSSNHVVHNR